MDQSTLKDTRSVGVPSFHRYWLHRVESGPFFPWFDRSRSRCRLGFDFDQREGRG
jgi:hypothetical protein